MRTLVFIFMLASVFATATYSKKSEAGLLIYGITTVDAYIRFRQHPAAIIGCREGFRNRNTFLKVECVVHSAGVFGAVVVAPVLFFTGNIIPGVVVLVLGEDGSLPQEELESMLMERYPNIHDREVISSLAFALKGEAEKLEVDQAGKKIVSLSEEKVRSILAPTDLDEEKVNQVITDLK